jgi:hypothetical protein
VQELLGTQTAGSPFLCAVLDILRGCRRWFVNRIL